MFDIDTWQAMDDEETEDKGYVWEAEYERPWYVKTDWVLACKITCAFTREAIQEDHDGRLLAPDNNELFKAKRRK